MDRGAGAAVVAARDVGHVRPRAALGKQGAGVFVAIEVGTGGFVAHGDPAAIGRSAAVQRYHIGVAPVHGSADMLCGLGVADGVYDDGTDGAGRGKTCHGVQLLQIAAGLGTAVGGKAAARTAAAVPVIQQLRARPGAAALQVLQSRQPALQALYLVTAVMVVIVLLPQHFQLCGAAEDLLLHCCLQVGEGEGRRGPDVAQFRAVVFQQGHGFVHGPKGGVVVVHDRCPLYFRCFSTSSTSSMAF